MVIFQYKADEKCNWFIAILKIVNLLINLSISLTGNFVGVTVTESVITHFKIFQSCSDWELIGDDGESSQQGKSAL